MMSENTLYGRLQELWWLLPITITVIIVRIFLERCCFMPLGRWLNVKESKKKPVCNTTLETAYSKLKRCGGLSSIAKKVDLSERQVERWWRLRRSQDKPSTLVKFCENMWLGSFYACSWGLGLYTLWGEEWFWDLDAIVEETDESAPTDVWWYYMISSAFYWSLTITQFWDVRRKDFWQMFVHHIATIALLTMSWLVNVYRIGCMVLILHDAAEVVLQFGKAGKHAQLPVTSLTYSVFTVIWIVTRLMLYPYSVLWRTTTRTIELNKLSYHILNAMLWLVFLLNIKWTWVIYRVSHKALTTGEDPGDMRSSSSDTEAEK